MPKLATVVDVNHYLETEFQEQDERINRLLELASGKVIRFTGQQFLQKVADVQKLPVGYGSRSVYLPQRPVTAVTAVSLLGVGVTALPAASYTWTPWGELTWIRGGWWPDSIQVTYTHGYLLADIPDDVVDVVCGVVARIWDNPTQEAQEAVDAHSVSHGTGAHLTLADKEILRGYKLNAVGSSRLRPSVEFRGTSLGVIGNA